MHPTEGCCYLFRVKSHSLFIADASLCTDIQVRFTEAFRVITYSSLLKRSPPNTPPSGLQRVICVLLECYVVRYHTP